MDLGKGKDRGACGGGGSGSSSIPSPWQVTRKGTQSKLEHLWETKEYSDLIVNVEHPLTEKSDSFSCHRLVLVMNSSVFETMLSDRWATPRPSSSSMDIGTQAVNGSSSDGATIAAVINLKEDPRIVKLALQFMYTNATPPDEDWADFLELMKFAHAYHIQDLVDRCMDHFSTYLTKLTNWKSDLRTEDAELVLPFYETVVQLCLPKLERLALTFIKRHSSDVLKMSSFLSISHSTLCKLLALGDLTVSSELDVFKGVCKWIDSECARQDLNPSNDEDRRRVLGPALGLIRFPAMKPDDFATQVGTQGLLTLEERVEVLTFFSMSTETRSKVYKLHHFFTQPRRAGSSLSPCYTLKRFEAVGPTDFDFSRNWRFLCFQVDHPIKLVSLGFYGAFSGTDEEFEVRVSVSQMAQHEREQDDETRDGIRQVIYDTKKRISAPGAEKVFKFELGEEVPIEAGRSYSIGYIIMGPTTYMGDVIQDTMTVQCSEQFGDANEAAHLLPNPVPVTFTFGMAKIKNNRYQIPEISFALNQSN